MTNLRTLAYGIGLTLGASLISGCGSSGSSGSSDSTVEGSVFASYVNGANVIISDVSGNQLAGPVTTGADGSFSVKIAPQYLGEALVFTATGGQFVDEATGQTVTNSSLSGMISADVLDSSGSTKIGITPSSSIIHSLVVDHGKTLEQAKTSFEAAFGYVPDETVLPVDATASNDDATDDQRLAGLRAAAFSQLTSDLGLAGTDQFSLLEKLAADIADGTLDGMENETTELSVGTTALGLDIQGKFAQAMVNFKDGGNNQTGLNDSQIGHLPFATMALSDSYKVTYVASDMMGAMRGKTTFKIKITDLDDNPQTGLSPMMMPMMNMAAHSHSSPKGSITEDPEEAGTYLATIYYLMASRMADGMSMGYWDLKIVIGEENVHFYPSVMMAMGDTARATLKGQEDKIPDMNSDMMMSRSYYLFKDDLSESGDNHSFSVFIATKESMMSFPTLAQGITLNASADHELVVSSIEVEMSTDEANWEAAVSEGSGIWTVAGLSGLTAGETGTVYVRLTVNDERKTDDGLAPDTVADNAEFSVTPSTGMGMSM